MQTLAKISTLGTSYTADQVTAILIDQQLQEQWLFDHYDAALKVRTDLSSYVDEQKTVPKITHDSTAVIQRTLKLTLQGNAPLKEINFLSDILGVRYQLRTPDGGWIEWSLGRFTLTPFDQDIFPGWTWHTLTAPDFGQLLTDANFLSPYTVLKNTSYINAINAIVVGYGGRTPIYTSIQPTTAVVPASIGFDAGSSRLVAINTLLAAIGYFPAWFDELGVMRSSRIPDYSKVSQNFWFDTTQGSSIVMIPIQERPDITKVFNQVLVLVEDARRTKFRGFWQNINPNDPVSLKNWHPKTLTIRDSSIPDQASADARARIEGQNASRIFGKKSFGTFPWAISQNRDVYKLTFSTLDEGDSSHLYVETKWDHTCQTGKMTTHTVEIIR